MSTSPELVRGGQTAHDGPRHAVAGPLRPVAAWSADYGQEATDEAIDGPIEKAVDGPMPEVGPEFFVGFRNALLPALAAWGVIAALAMLAWRMLG